MPRDSAGNYTLPLPPVAPGEDITAEWANTTLEDMRQGLTDSLDRNGRGSLNGDAPFRVGDGTLATPTLAFRNQTGTGWWRNSDGMNGSAEGTLVLRLNRTYVSVPVELRAGTTITLGGTDITTLFDPAGSAQGVQDNLDTHVDDTVIHFDDVPESDDKLYLRSNRAWVEQQVGSTGFIPAREDLVTNAPTSPEFELVPSQDIQFAVVVAQPATTDQPLEMELRRTSDSTWEKGNGAWSGVTGNANSSDPTADVGNLNAGMFVGTQQSATGDFPGSAFGFVYNHNNAAIRTQAEVSWYNLAADGITVNSFRGFNFSNTVAAHDRIRFRYSSGNIANAIIRYYIRERSFP